jgi:uncharacterized protein YuzE
MKHAYLEVTYRKGRPMAAYYYLPRRSDDRGVRTEQAGGGFLIDYSSDGRAIGIEITAPSRVDVAVLNALLARLGQEPVRREDLAPLIAA